MFVTDDGPGRVQNLDVNPLALHLTLGPHVHSTQNVCLAISFQFLERKSVFKAHFRIINKS